MSVLAVFLGASSGEGFTVTASPQSFGGASYNIAAPRAFGPCTVHAAGGSGSYSYAWTVVSTNSSATFSAPTAQATNITVGGIFGDTSYSIVRCTVTDTESGATARVDVLIQYTVYNTGPL